jgi:diacylglycerol kinase catalytic region
VDEAVGVIVAGRIRTVDLAHISNDTFPRRYVGAVVSTGYDARGNRSTNHIRLRLGALSYGYIAMRELASFSPLHYDMIIDGVRRRQEAMLVAVSNTGIFGGGMRIAPDADPADGFLDVTVVGPVSRTTLLRLLPSMYSGAFVKHPCVEQFRARSIELAGEGLFVMGDGEELGEVPVRVECVPGVLKVFVA